MTVRPGDHDSSLTRFEAAALTPALGAAVGFLLAARGDSGGWGVLPGLPVDLHQTAIALEAMALASPERAARIADEHGRSLWSELAEKLELLRLDQQIDAALILRTLAGERPEVRRELLATLRDSYGSQLRDAARPDLAVLSRFMLVLAAYGMTDTTEFEIGAKQLIDRQDPDGAWGSAGSDAELMTTAWAVRALAAASGERASRASRRGVAALWSRIEESGWHVLGLADDSYRLGIVLRAVAERPDGHVALLLDGLHQLRLLQRPDGGWAGSPDTPSTVERTAVAVLALAAAEGTTALPAKLAYLYFAESRAAPSQQGSSESFAVAVSRAARSGRVAVYAALIAASSSAVAVLANLATSNGAFDIGSWPVLAGVGLLAATTGLLIREQLRRLVRDRAEARAAADPEPPLIMRFLKITATVPQKLRRELVYLLYEEFLDVPPEVAARRSLSAGNRIGLDPPTARSFSLWAAEVAELTEQERRVLFERLRRVEL